MKIERVPGTIGEIRIGQLKAVEGMDGNMPTLTIWRGRHIIKKYRGRSLDFAYPHLTDEDRKHLASLVEGVIDV